MKFKIPRNRIKPLILLTLLCLLLAIITGLNHIEQMARYSRNETNDNYDSISKQTADLVKQNIENNFASTAVAANFVGQMGELNKETISTILPMIYREEKYIDLAIVDLEGKGYNISGDELNVSSKMYFVKAKYGEVNVSNALSYKMGIKPMMVYAAPINDKGECKGVLLISISAQMDMVTYKEEGELENRIIYLLNDTNDLVAFSEGSDINNFYYDRIIANGYLYEDSIKPNDNKLESLLELISNKKKVTTYVWFQKPLGLNNWTILVGRVDEISPITKNILEVTIWIWVGVMGSIFLLFMLMIYFQSKSNRKLINMLYYDPVTGGNNWYKFRLAVNRLLSNRNLKKRKYALINFDINRFKAINDSFGHQKGDEILKEIYSILDKWVDKEEPFTRYAADQFYILLSYQEEEEITTRLNELDGLLHGVNEIQNIKFCYGVYFITERKDSVDRMGDFAGIAKHAIKHSNDGSISFFDDIAKERLLKEEEIEKTMHAALKNNQFIVYLQPKYSIKEDRISGSEALVRWKSKEGDLVSPGYFIPVFEKNGFITELDNYMIRKVCELLRIWIDQSYRVLPISINLSRVHFADQNLAYNIRDIVDFYHIPHQLIELELTESAFIQNKEILIRTVILLRQFGFLVSMDDFGSGYSSLNSLKDLPLDVVKLDGELFRETEDIERGHTVIRNTILMAKDLHMEVVAEGIETKEQVDFLSGVGCDTIQGFYYARPMPVEQFENLYYKS